MATPSPLGRRWRASDLRTTWPRRWTRISGMSIRTGQTSKQAPHSDEAKGSDAVCLSTGWLGDPAQLRREDRADRAGIDGAVRLAAGPLVDRADVQARGAPDAAQRLAPERVGQDVGPAVVEQDQVEGLRPVAGRDAGPDRGVRVHPLRGRRAREQLEEDLEVAPRRDELLDAHDRDEDLGERQAHPAVALRLDDHDRAGLGDREVGAPRPRPWRGGTSRGGGAGRPRRAPAGRRSGRPARAARRGPSRR